MTAIHSVAELTVSTNASLRDCIEAIDRGAKQIALVVDDDQRLVATVTDGDIRRGLIRGESLESPVQSVMHTDPLTVPSGDAVATIESTMRIAGVNHLPVVGASGVLEGLAWIRDFSEAPKKDTRIVIMAGGLGTRLRPLTDNIPKPMLLVGGQPLLGLIIERFKKQGFYRFTLSVNYRKEIIREHFGDGSQLGVDIAYVEETQRMGTAGALSLLPEAPDAPFVVMNGDLLTAVQFDALLQFHRDEGAVATMCVREYSMQVPYGVVETNGSKLIGVEEKPVHRHYVNAGVYLLSPQVLKHIPCDEFYDMPTLFEDLLGQDESVSVFPIREYWMDVGRPEDLEQARMDVEAHKF